MLKKLARRAQSEQAGFTLVELIIAILIIGILSTIGVAYHQDGVAKARKASVEFVANEAYNSANRVRTVEGTEDSIVKLVQSYSNDEFGLHFLDEFGRVAELPGDSICIEAYTPAVGGLQTADFTAQRGDCAFRDPAEAPTEEVGNEAGGNGGVGSGEDTPSEEIEPEPIYTPPPVEEDLPEETLPPTEVERPTSYDGGKMDEPDPVTGGVGPYTVSAVVTQMATVQACFDATVATSAGSTPWEVKVHLNRSPFNGVADVSGFQIHTWGYKFQGPIVDGVATIVGTENHTKTVKSGSQLTFRACNYNLPKPRLHPQVSWSTTDDFSNVYNPCMSLTVTANTRWYAGWSVDVDMSDAIEIFKGSGGRPATSPGSGDVSTMVKENGIVTVTGIGWNYAGIKEGQGRTTRICWQS